jgi:hypothetical protein
VDDYPEKKQALADLIAETFGQARYPGGSNLVADQSGKHPDYQEVYDAFRGKHWLDVDLDTLRYHYDDFFLMTSEAYRFYLPAYMRATVLEYDLADNIPGSVVFSLTLPDSPGTDMDWFLSTMSGFSQAQKRTIVEFLRFLIEYHNGDFPEDELAIVLERYWLKHI